MYICCTSFSLPYVITDLWQHSQVNGLWNGRLLWRLIFQNSKSQLVFELLKEMEKRAQIVACLKIYNILPLLHMQLMAWSSLGLGWHAVPFTTGERLSAARKWHASGGYVQVLCQVQEWPEEDCWTLLPLFLPFSIELPAIVALFRLLPLSISEKA